jgi:hypothetical protein
LPKRLKVASGDLPTKDEQMQLRETQNLMSSGILHLQMEEMVSEVHYDVHKGRHLATWLLDFVEHLKSAKLEKKKVIVTSSWLQKSGITCLDTLNYAGNSASLTFCAPQEVEVVGSYPLKTSTKPFLNVDVLVTMPTTCFDER